MHNLNKRNLKMNQQPANEDDYENMTAGDWLFSLLVSVGAFSALIIALAVTL
jgi:hypothetical protein